LAGDITFSVSSSADKEFTIGYAATDPCEGPVGIGLKVTVTGSCEGSVSGGANVVSSDPCFSVHIDYAHDLTDPNTYTIGMGGQHPLADPCGAGVPDPCSTMFSICMGRLDPNHRSPQSVPNLITVRLDCDASCTVTVDVEEDGLRGGIVGADWGTVNATASTSVECVSDCLVPCWECATQCKGDVAGDPTPICDADVDTYDWSPFRNAFGTNYCDDWNGGAGPYNPCADLDRDGDVDTSDWSPFRNNFGSSGLTPDCTPSCTWPPPCE
jgi:hypothetical protein